MSVKRSAFDSLLLCLLVTISCDNRSVDPDLMNVKFRSEMRSFVRRIAETARITDPDFLVVPQNGQELITRNGEPDGPLMDDYVSVIDGAGREDLFYGYLADNLPTPVNETAYMVAFCDVCEQNGVEVLTTDYCSTHTRMDDSYAQNESRGYISFSAPRRDLDVIPDYPSGPFHVNNNEVSTLQDARNFIYLIDPGQFTAKTDFLISLSDTDYDLLIIDLFFGADVLTSDDVAGLKTKKNGGGRLVLCYLSIGEAEDYRYYWQAGWSSNPPDWLGEENPDWEGNYKVRYWSDPWQNIVCGDSTSYLQRVLEAGFDGVYLDLIDAFEYFEELTNGSD